ncbi:reverse transcriptase-like protein [Terrilactibacillus laevilacticus]|uniref:Reverse transcriptase-like protein n=1 Tax=Terrilactibacillus laevilacticus TaxID=1380157 RepID=A0ABW5PPI7_9BACI|nr:reverse transcriptase-like protein [Terrilactibacillus laevilacticus]
MIDVYFDGASAGNPGLSGAGIYINHHSKEERQAIPLGVLSNHEAEFEAFIHALSYCKNHGYLEVSFRTDSQLVNQSIEKGFVKRKDYQNYLERATKLIDEFNLFFIKWIPSKQNKNADELAKKAIQDQLKQA